MKKSIFLFFAAILCAMTANAYNQLAKDLYFDNSEAKWEKCYVYIGKSDYTSCYDMTRVTGTQYLWQLPANFNGGSAWNGATGWVVCCEKWWASSQETIDKYTWHGDKKVTQKTGSAWGDTKIYKTNGTASTTSDKHTIQAYKVTSYDKSNYTVTINTVEGGTLTVKDYDDNAVATGASKIHLTVLKFSAAPASGYVLDGVEINDGTNTTTIAAADLATKTHTLTSAVTITPVWRATTSSVTVTATATNGTVTGGGVVEEGTPVTLTATPNAGYQFVNWTVGGVEVSTANPYTFTAEEDVTVVANFEELPKVTVYAINSIGWAAVAVHHWHEGGAGTAWPGDLMTTIAEKDPNGFDVYTATFLKEHENCIFNNNNQGSQTSTLAVKDGQYYDLKSNTWYASLAEVPAPDPLATDVYLKGGWDGWAGTEFKKAAADATTATITLTLAASTEYEFKVQRQGIWTSSKDNRDIKASVSGLVFSKDISDNTKLTTAAAGNYVFTWDINQSQLSIAYPEVTPEYKDITIQVYAKEVPNIWWWNGGDQCPSTEDLVNPATGNKYQWTEAPAMEKVAGEDNWYTKTFTQVDITRGGIKFKLQSTDHSDATTAEVVTTEDKCYDARVIATVTETTCGELPSGEIPTVTYNVTVPAETPACYIAGAMTGWSHKAMTKVDETHYTITIEGAQKTQEYKYSASNNWDLVELKADGSDMGNRTWTENDVVAQWKVPAPTTYTVAGNNTAAFGTEWDPTNAANDMVLEGGLYKWTKTNVALSANTEIKFQVVKNHDWSAGQWPGSGNDWVLNTITEDGLYTITITFKEDDKTINAKATKTGDIVTKDFSNQPATLYFHPSFHWTSDNAQFAAYFYNNGPGADAEPTWKSMTAGANGVYEVPNAKEHEYVIFCRMNPERAENNWDNNVMWNQIETGITIPNAAGDLNTCLAFWTNCQGKVPTSECTWVAPTPLTDKNWDAFIAAYNGKTINAVVERSFKSGQNHTLCLPFDLPTNWLGEGAKAYQLSRIVENADELKLTVTTHTTISAGKPYIIVPVKGEEYEHLIVSNVTVKNATAATNSAVGANYQATLKAVTATNGTTNGSTEYYVGANDGCLYNAVVDKLGLRAVIELTTTGGQPLPAKVRAYVATGENEATGFENIVAPEGQTIKAIVNGQLVIIRGGEMYNVQGQVIR